MKTTIKLEELKKICTKCGETKLLSEFNELKHQCKQCVSKYNAEYYRLHRLKKCEDQRNYYWRNKGVIL